MKTDFIRDYCNGAVRERDCTPLQVQQGKAGTYIAKEQGRGGVSKRKQERSGEIPAKLAQQDSCRRHARVIRHHPGVGEVRDGG